VPPDGRIHGGACIDATGNGLADSGAARIAALKDLLARFQGSDLRVLALLEDVGRPAAPGMRALPPPFALGPAESLVAEAFAPGRGFRQDCGPDACNLRTCCHAVAHPDAVQAGVATLLGKVQLDDVLEAALRDLSTLAGPSATRMIVYRFTDSGLSGALGDFLAERTEGIAASRKVFRPVPRAELDDILKAARLDFASLSRAPEPVRRRLAERFDGVLAGSFSRQGPMLNLQFVLLDTRGVVRATAANSVFLSALPERVRQTPAEEQEGRDRVARLEAEQKRLLAEAEDARKAREADWKRREQALRDEVVSEQRARIEAEVRKGLAGKPDAAIREAVSDRIDQQVRVALDDQFAAFKAGAAAGSPLAVNAWVDRGCGATYPVGSQMVVYVRCSKDCWVKVFHTSADGETKLLFPNKVDRNNRLAGGEVHPLGDASYPFQFDITPPLGVEMISVVASDKAFSDAGETARRIEADGVVSLGRIAGKEYGTATTRGLSPPEAKAAVARSDCRIRVAK
jgi:hypothetical protein